AAGVSPAKLCRRGCLHRRLCYYPLQMPDQPRGELVIQTIAMPQDTNPNGDIFGGWVTSQMDLGSGILAAKTAQARVVTAAMEGMSFLQPVRVGDTVRCYAHVEKIGRTSMTIPVEVWLTPCVSRCSLPVMYRVTQTSTGIVFVVRPISSACVTHVAILPTLTCSRHVTPYTLEVAS